MSDTSSNTSLFGKLNSLIKKKNQPEKRMIRHAQEREIVDIALSNLSQSEVGQELLDFLKEKEIRISVLRGRDNRDYSPNENGIFITVSSDTEINDPEITINLIASIREAMHEYDPILRKVSFDNGEALYIQREENKLSDKLQWQTVIVYELGKIANKTEFIDSFTIMGYHSLIDIYEKDLTES